MGNRNRVGTGAPPKKKGRLKQVLLGLLKVGISAGLIALFFYHVDWAELKGAFESADPKFWGLAVLLFLVSNLLGALQWRVLLRTQNIRLPVHTVVGLYFVGVFFNNFLVSNIGGDAMRVYDLKRLTGRGLAGFAATFLDRFVGLFTLICFSVVAYAVSPDLWGTALWVPILILAMVLLGVLCFGFSRRLSGWVVVGARARLPARIADGLEEARESFLLYRHAYGELGRVGLLSTGVQVCRVSVFYAVGLAMGQTVGFRDYVVFIPLVAIVAAIPISFGGIGVRENVGAVLFGRVGMEPAPALAVMFLGYLAGVVASLAGGILFALRRPGAGVRSGPADVTASEDGG